MQNVVQHYWGKKIHIGLSVLEKIIYGQSNQYSLPLADIQVGIFRTQAICFSRQLKIKKSWCEWPYERTRATNTGGERPRRMEGYSVLGGFHQSFPNLRVCYKLSRTPPVSEGESGCPRR